jgi:hypothetical protein
VYTADFGTRYDAFFSFDFMASYAGKLGGYSWELSALLYNAYDFGTELSEYNFPPPPPTEGARPGGRFSLMLCIPRGLMLTLRIGDLFR